MRRRLVNLAVSENYLRDSALAEATTRVWSGEAEDGGQLVSELWVQGAFPSKSSEDSLESLAAEGLFPKDLCRYLNSTGFPGSRRLFTHQADAFRHAAVSKSG